MSWQALSRADYEDLERELVFAFKEMADSTLAILRRSGDTTHDADFGHVLQGSWERTEFNYTQMLSSPVKQIDATGSAFFADTRHRAYILGKEVRERLPGGAVHREAHKVEINGLVHDILAVVPFPIQHEKPLLYKLHLSDARPATQYQGDR